MLLQIMYRLVFVILIIVQRNIAQDIKQYFSQCSKLDRKTFDKCLKNALNEMRIFYKTGKETFEHSNICTTYERSALIILLTISMSQ